MRYRRTGPVVLVMLFVASCSATRADDDHPRARYRVPPADNALCGVDCLYVCARVCGRHDVTLAELEKELPATAKGVTVEELVRACRRRSLMVTVFRTDVARLGECGFPLLLHVNNRHFIAVLGIEDGSLVLFDSSIGLYDCSPEWFAKQYTWDGVAVMFGPPSPWMTLSMHAPLFVAAALILFPACAFFMFGRRAIRKGTESCASK